MRRFGLALLVGFVGITLAGCGSMCGPKKVKEEPPPYTPPAVVRPAPQPAPVPTPPPPKKDRN